MALADTKAGVSSPYARTIAQKMQAELGDYLVNNGATVVTDLLSALYQLPDGGTILADANFTAIATACTA